MKIILNELIVKGATQKLEELNRQREALIKVIDKFSNTPIPRLSKKGRARKKLHWTQTPVGRRKMAIAQKKAWIKRNAKSK